MINATKLSITASNVKINALPNIFSLILFCYRNISAIWFQLLLNNPTKTVMFYTKRVIKHWRNIIFTVIKKGLLN